MLCAPDAATLAPPGEPRALSTEAHCASRSPSRLHGGAARLRRAPPGRHSRFGVWRQIGRRSAAHPRAAGRERRGRMRRAATPALAADLCRAAGGRCCGSGPAVAAAGPPIPAAAAPIPARPRARGAPMTLHLYFVRKFLASRHAGRLFRRPDADRHGRAAAPLRRCRRRACGAAIGWRAQRAADALPHPAADDDPGHDHAFPGLARSSELVVTRAAGRSALRALSRRSARRLPHRRGGRGGAQPHRRGDVAQLRGDGAAIARRLASCRSASEGLWLRQGGRRGADGHPRRTGQRRGTVLYDVTFQAPFGPDAARPVRAGSRPARRC